MDRRDFLKTTSAAAVAAPASAVAASEVQVAAPAILSGSRQLTLSSSSKDLPGSGADRLARRIETATDGRYRIDQLANAGTDADLTYGNAWRHAGLHRAFAFFAGLPFSQEPRCTCLQTWLAVGGGAMLWDELAAELGFKPLVPDIPGPAPASGPPRAWHQPDLASARPHVEGLAGDVLRDLGAVPTTLAPENLRAALADGQLQAAEWLGPLAAAAPDLQPLAQRLYQPGFNRNGLLLSLSVKKPLWDGMSAADRAIFEACAAQEYHLSLTDAAAHALIASQVEAPSKWPVRLAWPSRLAEALDRAAAEVVERIAATDAASRRIHDSYRAFRRLLGEPATI